MLLRAFRFTPAYLCPARPRVIARYMSAPSPLAEGSKRALSPSTTPTSAPVAPDTKRVKLSTDEVVAGSSTETSAAAPQLTAKQTRKVAGRSNNSNGKQGGGRKSKVKAPKPGGVEEAGAFDVIELLGAERVEELERLEKDEGKDWRKAAETEWGSGPNGKDVELRIVGINSHGEFQSD